jgi:hypothetical protein
MSLARLTVQFQSVLEKFSPHDTVFGFEKATDLTESALSSACMLHTSIGSLASSTSSLHRRRLGEITEDAEEGPSGRPKSGLRHSILSDDDSYGKDGKTNFSPQVAAATQQSLDSLMPKSNISSAPASQISDLPPLPSFDKSLPATPIETPRSTIHEKVTDGDDAPAVDTQNPSKLEDRRPSFDDRQPALNSDHPYQNTAYSPHKPKVKRGPRPSAQRPHTPRDTRLVANLPTSVRVSNRPPSAAGRPPSSASHRPVSQQSNRSTHSAYISHHIPTPPPPLPQPAIHISALYQAPISYLINRPASPAPSATPSIALSLTPSTTPSRAGITPEKQRLMRALHLRKKQQMEKVNQTKSSVPPVPSLENTKNPDSLPPIAGTTATATEDTSTTRVEENADVPTIAAGPHKDSSQEPPMRKHSQELLPSPPGQTPSVPVKSETQQLDSSSHSLEADAISSTAESESATSEATAPSLKDHHLPENRSPVLPLVTPLQRLSMGLSAPFPIKQSQSLKTGEPAIRKCIPEEKEETITNPELSNSPPENVAEEKEETSTSPETSNSPPEDVAEEKEETSTNPETSNSPPEDVAEVNPANEPAPSEAGADGSVEDLQPAIPSQHKLLAPPSADRKTMRHGMLDPGKFAPSPEASDISDDESLYDELQTATVQEAKPVVVARSPINAVFNRGSPDRQRDRTQSASIPSGKAGDSTKSTPEKGKVGVGRSTSSALPQWPPTKEPAQSTTVKKPNVSSGISERIRALQIFSGRTDSNANSPISGAPPSPPSATSRLKQRWSAHSPDNGVVRKTSLSTPPARQLAYPSPAPTPTPAPTSAELQSLSLQTNPPNVEMLAPKRKGESISVTARIIRDEVENVSDEPLDHSRPVAMNLHRSPLVVEHERATADATPEAPLVVEPVVTPTRSKEPDDPPAETPKSDRRRFSFSSNPSTSGRVPHSDSFTKRLSLTIRHTRGESGNLPRSTSDSSSVIDEKSPNDSRKTRLMKRMSVLTAGSRRSIASAFGSRSLKHDEPGPALLQPEVIAEHSREGSTDQSSISEIRSHVVDIGDVNIQFPDTLLWKRRFMRIDDQGWLILTPPTMEANKRGVSRRFHLSDFKKPTLPPIEREELPWSIVMDFEDGSCLQCACESRYAQGQVLRSKLPSCPHNKCDADPM